MPPSPQGRRSLSWGRLRRGSPPASSGIPAGRHTEWRPLPRPALLSLAGFESCPPISSLRLQEAAAPLGYCRLNSGLRGARPCQGTCKARASWGTQKSQRKACPQHPCVCFSEKLVDGCLLFCVGCFQMVHFPLVFSFLVSLCHGCLCLSAPAFTPQGTRCLENGPAVIISAITMRCIIIL